MKRGGGDSNSRRFVGVLERAVGALSVARKRADACRRVVRPLAFLGFRRLQSSSLFGSKGTFPETNVFCLCLLSFSFLFLVSATWLVYAVHRGLTGVEHQRGGRTKWDVPRCFCVPSQKALITEALNLYLYLPVGSQECTIETPNFYCSFTKHPRLAGTAYSLRRTAVVYFFEGLMDWFIYSFCVRFERENYSRLPSLVSCFFALGVVWWGTGGDLPERWV